MQNNQHKLTVYFHFSESSCSTQFQMKFKHDYETKVNTDCIKLLAHTIPIFNGVNLPLFSSKIFSHFALLQNSCCPIT